MRINLPLGQVAFKGNGADYKRCLPDVAAKKRVWGNLRDASQT